MRFDTTLYYHVGDDYSWRTLFKEMRQTVELLDELGFTGLWLAEHHFAFDVPDTRHSLLESTGTRLKD